MKIVFFSFKFFSREINSIFMFVSKNLSRNKSKCCLAKIVVGASTATCLLFLAQIKAALRAISVLPNPTSPQINLSWGFSDARSFFTSAITLAWSFVSWNPKPFEKESNSSWLIRNCLDLSIFLEASASNNSAAISKAFFLVFSFFIFQLFFLSESSLISLLPW